MNREDIVFHARALLDRPDADAFARLMRSAPPADVADALRDSPPTQVAALLAPVPAKDQARLFVELPDVQQDAVLAEMPPAAVVPLVSALPSDERADLYNRLSPDGQRRLLPSLAQAERDDMLHLARYPEGTAGAAVTSQYATVPAGTTVADALRAIRATAPDKETIYVVYVLDGTGHLRGTVSLRDLVLAADNASVDQLMRPDPVTVHADDPDEKAAECIRRYDLLAVPVLNEDNRMIGIVTVDDAMDIDHEQDATQLARYGGTSALSGPDLDLRASPLRRIFGVRVFWLGILTVFGLVTSTFVAAQEDMLQEVIVLAAFIAPIVDMGGNTGSQAATLVLRSMALGQLRPGWRDIWFVTRRELGVAAGLGAVIAILEVVLAYFAKGGLDAGVLATVGLSMLVCTVLGGVIGGLLPFAARRIGTDPATLSAPLITSVMDLIGVFVYFGFAYLFLGNLLV
ncbi:magnesium transporter [Streptomyces sp. NPDC057555]|uniref:magnesium transporter n=1 Tax=Streptomyces sp. NPDC057555 TaxID=3346166 RepID=UPI0036C79016